MDPLGIIGKIIRREDDGMEGIVTSYDPATLSYRLEGIWGLLKGEWWGWTVDTIREHGVYADTGIKVTGCTNLDERVLKLEQQVAQLVKLAQARGDLT